MADLPSIDIEKAVLDPAGTFDDPQDVVKSHLAAADKLKILEAWELDAKREGESANEGMAGDQSVSLRSVRAALAQVGND